MSSSNKGMTCLSYELAAVELFDSVIQNEIGQLGLNKKGRAFYRRCNECCTLFPHWPNLPASESSANLLSLFALVSA